MVVQNCVVPTIRGEMTSKMAQAISSVWSAKTLKLLQLFKQDGVTIEYLATKKQL